MDVSGFEKVRDQAVDREVAVECRAEDGKVVQDFGEGKEAVVFRNPSVPESSKRSHKPGGAHPPREHKTTSLAPALILSYAISFPVSPEPRMSTFRPASCARSL